MPSESSYTVKTLKPALLGWILAATGGFLMLLIPEGLDLLMILFIAILLLSAPILILTSGTIELSGSGLTVCVPFRTYRIEWKEIEAAETNLWNIVFRGDRKRLTVWDYRFWGGDEKDAAYERMERMLKKQKIALQSSFVFPYFRNTRYRPGTGSETASARWSNRYAAVLSFFVVTLLLLGLILGLHWLLYYHTRTLSPFYDASIAYWIVFLLPPGVLWFWLRRLDRSFQLNGLGGMYVPVFYLWLMISLPASFNACSLDLAKAKMTELDDVGQIDRSEPTSHYTFRNYYIDRYHIGVDHWTRESWSGRRSQDHWLEMHVDIAVPILPAPGDTAGSVCRTWLIVSYEESVDFDQEQSVIDAAYDEFIRRSQEDFDARDFTRFVYLERSFEPGRGLNAIRANPKYQHADPITFIPYYRSVEARQKGLLISPVVLYVVLSIGWVATFLQLASKEGHYGRKANHGDAQTLR